MAIMWVHLMTLLSCFACGIIANTQEEYETVGLSTTPTKGKPWPMPKSYNSTNKVYSIDGGSFKFNIVGSTCDTLTEAVKRYEAVIFGQKDNSLRFRPKFQRLKYTVASALNINVKSECEIYPTLESDESYSLSLDDNAFTLTSNGIWGAIRGLETFSQLILHVAGTQYEVNGTTIEDAPRFQHRGLLLDTSRHFLDISLIYKTLEAMAMNKMNVFHWHIVDDQSFPYDSKDFPDMAKKGAYTSTHVYSQQDVKNVIEEARKRGIRVIAEFDTPGHTQSWGNSIKDLLTPCYSGSKPNGQFGPIDPSQDFNYDFLSKFFSEVGKVFPDHYIHLGGDEVSFDCWKNNPNITQFMKQKGFGTDYAKLEEYYMQRLLDIVGGLNKGYLIWQDVIDNGAKVRQDTVVEVWRAGYQKEMAKVTSQGYQALLSSCWYLNYIAYGSDWLKYYICDPHDFNGTAEQFKLVIGGEACMWGEYVDDTNLISRTWPRASVVAERLWSPLTVNDYKAAAPRLEEHRCRMISRGFAAESINGPGYCPDEYKPPGF